MAKFVKGTLLAGVVSLAIGSVASAQLTDAEFRCQRKVNKAGSDFVKSKMKCVSRCMTNARNGLNPLSYCFPPYGGSTLTCITEQTFRKGAEEKFSDAIRKSCDPTFEAGTDCPECYSEGDCSLAREASDRVQNVEGQLDSFVPGAYCDQPAADDAETACEQNTVKTIVKFIGSLNKCYDKCNRDARRGLIDPSSCMPPATDPKTAACINKAAGKSIAGIDRKCGDVGAIPDCTGIDDYPDGATWTNLFDVWFSGNVPGTYCASPSRAFLD